MFKKRNALGSITKSNLRNEDNECEADEEESESIGRLVSETVHFILPEQEVLVGGWALVDGSHLSDQIDTVLLLTRYFNHRHKAFCKVPYAFM